MDMLHCNAVLDVFQQKQDWQCLGCADGEAAEEMHFTYKNMFCNVLYIKEP